ncbi:MAG: ABC transporter substrate-binding protein [Dehalococcoidia bacterium]|nr:ABC transporter substrate-binding protein [Dehalococcoidia bacterium]
MVAIAIMVVACEPRTESPITTTETQTPQSTSKPTETSQPTQPTQTPTSTTPSSTARPTYGGTITVGNAGTGSFAAPGVTGMGQEYIRQHLVYQPLAQPDWSKGPEGTKEISFNSAYTPMEYHSPLLAESWEIPNLATYIFHLRKGVRFHNKRPAFGREMTAADWVWSLQRIGATAGAAFPVPPTKVTAVDKYTLRIEIADPDPNAFWNLMYGHFVYAPEMGDSADWRDANGTGPYMVKEVVVGSSATLVRNPDYFETDPLYPGNRLPYIDQVREIFITDPATQLAALRAGKIDRAWGVAWQDAEQLQKTNPGILSKKGQGNASMILVLRIDNDKFKDLRVRQALSMAIDKQAILQHYYRGNADLISWPLQPDSINEFTPYDKLPADLKQLWEYHPDKARQLLAEAGFPNGFKTTMLMYPSPSYQDVAAIVKDNWIAVGVDVTLVPSEPATYWNIVNATPRGFETNMAPYGNSNPYNFFNRFYRPPHNLNWFWTDKTTFQDDYINEARNKINSTLDPAERSKMIKQLGLDLMGRVYVIPMPLPSNYTFWQPWLRGYSGEIGIGHVWGYEGFWQYVWIDQDLKAKITGVKQ